MGILYIAGEDARHQLAGRRDVVRRLSDKQHVPSHLHQNTPNELLDVYLLLQRRSGRAAKARQGNVAHTAVVPIGVR